MELMHYAEQAIQFDRSVTYLQREPHSYIKPRGFWVSVLGEDDWPSWCKAEEFRPQGLAVAHTVTLAESANVHMIDNPFALDAFTGTYAVQTEWERRFSWRTDDQNKWPIDWREVVKDCDGLIIAPYQWSRRMETDWYYGWDCASGCIWNLDAIASVEPVTDSAEVAS